MALKKKIILVSRDAWNLYNYRRGLINALLASGFEVIAVGQPDSTNVPKLIKLGAKFLSINIAKKNKLDLTKSIWRLFQIYKTEKPDIVHHFTIKPVIFGTLVARLAGVRYRINTITGLGYSFGESSKMYFQRFVILLYKISQSQSTFVFFQNKSDRDLFINHHIINMDQTGIVPGSGVDIAYFAPRPKISKTGLTILMHARLIEEKGHRIFVQAANQLYHDYPKIKFQLLGKVDELNPSQIPKSQLDEWAKGKNIEILSEKEDVRPFIANADIVVLPSFYREGVPRSLLEAAAMGKPLIASDVPGCTNIVRHNQNGLIFKSKDVNSFVRALKKLIDNKSLRIQMGKKSREIATKYFDENIVINLTVNKYRELLDQDVSRR